MALPTTEYVVEVFIETASMVLSMLLAMNTCPALLGTSEAIRQSQSKERKEEHRARRCNLIVTCVKSSSRSRELNGRQVVLKDNKVGTRSCLFLFETSPTYIPTLDMKAA